MVLSSKYGRAFKYLDEFHLMLSSDDISGSTKRRCKITTNLLSIQYLFEIYLIKYYIVPYHKLYVFPQFLAKNIIKEGMKKAIIVGCVAPNAISKMVSYFIAVHLKVDITIFILIILLIWKHLLCNST